MRLQDIMTSPVQSIQQDEPVEDAWSRMRASRIHHMVVLDGGDVAGILSTRDLGGPGGARSRAGRTAADLMTTPVVTTEARCTVREAANKLRGRAIGCLPVVDRGRLVGIVTVSDLLELIGRGAERPVPAARRRELRRRGPRRQPRTD